MNFLELFEIYIYFMEWTHNEKIQLPPYWYNKENTRMRDYIKISYRISI